MARQDRRRVRLVGGVARQAAIPETLAILARMTSQPTQALADLLDDWVRAVRDGGVLSKLDGAYWHNLHDAQAAGLNLVAAGAVTLVGTVGHVYKQGFTGDGVDDYIDYNRDIGGSLTNFKQNTACLIGMDHTNNTGGASLGISGSADLRLLARNGSDLATCRINGTGNVSGPCTDSRGVTAVNRSAASGTGCVQLYKNGVQIGTANTASVVLTGNLLGLRSQTAYSNRTSKFAALGRSLTAAEHQLLATACLAFEAGVNALP